MFVWFYIFNSFFIWIAIGITDLFTEYNFMPKKSLKLGKLGDLA